MSKKETVQTPKRSCKCAVIVGLVTLTLSGAVSYYTYDYNRNLDKEAVALAKTRQTNCMDIAHCSGYEGHEAVAVNNEDRYDVYNGHHYHLNGCLVKTEHYSSSEPYFYFEEIPGDKTMGKLTNAVCRAAGLFTRHMSEMSGKKE